MQDAEVGAPSGDSTLDEARAWLRERARAGQRCPCCKQFTKVYKRRLGSHMARWLIWLVQRWLQIGGPEVWIDIKDSPVRGGDYAKLIHWGLVVHKAKDEEDTERRHSALWRPTADGIDFVMGRIRVPSHVYLYDGLPIRAHDEAVREITTVEALGKKFSYAELMAERVPMAAPL